MKKKTKFKIAGDDGVSTRQGEIITIAGQKFGLHKEKVNGFWPSYRCWVVTHLPTGCFVCYDLTKEAALTIAKGRVESIESKLPKVLEKLKARGIAYPVNKGFN